MVIPSKASQVMDLLQDAGARDVLIVGGFVRDSLLKVDSKDVDIEVYGMSLEQIEEVLSNNNFKVSTVGKAFGVLKIDNEIDVSVPRRENKVGVGHKGFNVMPDPDMSIEEAASRRDFTINSMAMSAYGDIIDPFGGIEDLKMRVLVPTSDAFVEDPLRVLRGMQFAARFNLILSDSFLMMSRGMVDLFGDLPKERVWEEWKKWALKSILPSIGLDVLVDTNWIMHFPEINALRDVPQDPEWHPEGDVFVHTKHVVDAAAEIADREQLGEHDRLVLMLAALSHDFGKPSTTKMQDGRWRSRGHCEDGVEPAERFMLSIGAPLGIIAEVKPLIAEHLVHCGIDDPSPKAVRRLAKRLHPSNVKMLSMVVESDHNGRPPLPKGNPLSQWVTLANELNVVDRPLVPIIGGRDLISLGVEPGKDMGKIIASAFEAQLDGVFSNLPEGLRWLASTFDLSNHK